MGKRYLFSVAASLIAALGMAQTDKLVVEDVTISPGSTKMVAIQLQNASSGYTAFQFDMVLPEGIEIVQDENYGLMVGLIETRAADHSFHVKNIAPNTYRFLSYSETNSNFVGDDGDLIHVFLKADEELEDGSETAAIYSGLLVSATGEQEELSDLSIGVVLDSNEGTAIQSIDRSQTPLGDWYNLNGLRVKTPNKGLYIRNGKKVVIK